MRSWDLSSYQIRFGPPQSCEPEYANSCSVPAHKYCHSEARSCVPSFLFPSMAFFPQSRDFVVNGATFIAVAGDMSSSSSNVVQNTPYSTLFAHYFSVLYVLMIYKVFLLGHRDDCLKIQVPQTLQHSTILPSPNVYCNPSSLEQQLRCTLVRDSFSPCL